MVLDRADATPVGDPDHQRHSHLASGAEADPGDLGHNLVERRVDEAVELDLHDRTVAAHREPDGRADDAGFRERGVDHPVRPEVGLQPLRHPEHPAQLADVLTGQHHLRVRTQGPTEAGVERLGHGQVHRVTSKDAS